MAVQRPEIAIGFKFEIQEVKELHLQVVRTTTLIRWAHLHIHKVSFLMNLFYFSSFSNTEYAFGLELFP